MFTIAPPRPCASICAQLVLHAEEHAAQVDVDRALPVFEGVVDERLRIGRDARDVAGPVEAAEPSRPRTRPSPRPTRRRRRRRAIAAAAAPISAAVAVAAASLTSATTTCAPRRPSRRAVAWPIPLAAAGHQRDRHAAIPRSRGTDPTARRARSAAGSHVGERERRVGHHLDRFAPLRGRSITAVAPSVATARSGASAFTAIPVPRSSVANEIVSRSSAALLGAYVDERACCGLSSWSVSTIALVMLTIQPAPRSRDAGNDRLRQQVRRDDVDLVRDAQPPLRRLVDAQVEARGRRC